VLFVGMFFTKSVFGEVLVLFLIGGLPILYLSPIVSYVSR